MVEIKDTFGNALNFSYATSLYNYATFAQSTANTSSDSGYPLTQVKSSNGNTMTFEYMAGSKDQTGNLTPPKVKVSTGSESVTYEFIASEFGTSEQKNQLPTLAYVEKPANDSKQTILKTSYSYRIGDAYSDLGSTGEIRNPYALISTITHPTGALTNYAYVQDATSLCSNTSSTSNNCNNTNDVLPVTKITNSMNVQTDSEVKSVTLKSMTITHNGDMSRPYYTDNTFDTTVTELCQNSVLFPTDSCNPSSNDYRKTTYRYGKDSNSSIPFFKLTKKTEVRGDFTHTTTFTYDTTTTPKRPDPISTSVVISRTGNVDTDPKLTITTSKTYDSYHNVTSETNPLNVKTIYNFDTTYHFLNSVQEFVQGSTQYRTTTYKYDTSKRVVTNKEVRDQNSTLLRQEAYIYDTHGNIIEKDVTDSNNTKIATKTDYLSNGTLFFSYPKQRTVTQSDPDHISKTVTQAFEYDVPSGELKTYTDGRGNSIKYEYDGLKRVKQASYDDGTGVMFTYDDVNNTIQQDAYTGTTTDPTINKSILKMWNPLGWETDEVLFDNGVRKTLSHLEYDSIGRVTKMQDAMGNETNNLYDESDRIKKVTYADQSTQQVDYDDVNLTVETTDTLSNKVRETHDVLGHTLKKEASEGDVYHVVSTSTFDNVGDILTSSDAPIVDSTTGTVTSHTTKYQYDAMSELTSVTSPDNSTWNYTYDMRGNVVQIQGPQSSTQKQYDELGNLILVTDGKGLSDKYYYDPNGNISKHIDRKNQTTTFQYDIHNRMTNKTSVSELGVSETVENKFDNLGNRIQMTDGTGTSTYTYTVQGELKSVKYPDGNQITYSYDDNGNRTQLTDPFGQTTTYTIDNRNRLSQLKLQGATDAEVKYQYNGGAGTLQEADYVNGMKFAADYDYANRMTSLTQTLSNSETPVNSYSYTYDLNGNQTTRVENNNTSTFTYDSMNRISTSSEFNESYTYDGSGDRQTLQSESDEFPIENSYVYDGLNRLKKVTTPDGKTITYKYNGDGVLYERTDSSGTIRYYYDGNNMIAEATVRNGAPTLFAHYVRDDKGRLITRVDANGSKAYYSYNGHGDISELRDSSGNLLNRYTYDIWGNPLTTTEKVQNSFRFSSEFLDNASGLLYLHARWYDPKLGRFINEDTYGGQMDRPLSMNLYTYAENNPLINFDPTGHWTMVYGDCVTYAVAEPGDTLSGLGNQLGTDWQNLGYQGAPENLQVGEQVNVSNYVTNLFGGTLNTKNLGNMTKADILKSLPPGWKVDDNNGRVHVRDENGTMRLRIDPPDKNTTYDHVHLYDKDGNPLDQDLNIVSKRSPDAHIPYKGPNDPGGTDGDTGDEYDPTATEDDEGSLKIMPGTGDSLIPDFGWGFDWDFGFIF